MTSGSPRIEIRLLGTIDVRVHGGPPLSAVLAQPKRMALLAFLACSRPSGLQQRDKLLGMFWPELTTERARKALRQSLYHLRSTLGHEAFVSIGDGEVGVSREHVWCDAAEVARLLPRDPVKACALYHGDLMPGFHIDEGAAFEEWLEGERLWLRRQAVEGASHLALHHQQKGDTRSAIAWARKAVEWQPGEEVLVRQLMQQLVSGGDRAAALREFELFVRRLKRDYELDVSAETKSYADEIRNLPATSIHQSLPTTSTAEVAVEATPDGAPPALRKSRPAFHAVAAIVLISAVALAMRVASAGDRIGDRSEVGANACAEAILPRFSGTRSAASVLLYPFTLADATTTAVVPLRGVQQQVQNHLAATSAIDLVGPTAAELFAPCNRNAIALARHFGVATVLTGDVSAGRDTKVLNVALIDANDGHTLWASRFAIDTTPASLVRIEAAITQNVARTLGVKVTDDVLTGLASSPTANYAAYNHYLTGRVQLERFHYQSASESFRRAVDADSTFGEAWAGLGIAMSLLRFANGNSTAYNVNARHALMQANKFAPTAIDTRLAEGIAKLYLQNDFEVAFQTMRALREERPIDPRPPLWMAIARLFQQRFDEAAALADSSLLLDRTNLEANKLAGWLHATNWRFENARENLQLAHVLAPGDTILAAWLFMVHINGFRDTASARRFVETLPTGDQRAFRQTLALYQRDPIAAEAASGHQLERLYGLSRIHHANRRTSVAEAYADTILELLQPKLNVAEWGESPPLVAARILGQAAIAHALRGDVAQSRRTISRAVRLSAESPDDVNRAVIRIMEARVYALLGDAEQTAAVLELLFTPRSQRGLRLRDMTPNLVRLDPDFVSVRSAPAVQRVLGRFDYTN